jgi:protein-disulfide isomerase
MKTLKGNTVLAISIMFAAIVIGGSIVFFGLQISDSSGEAAVMNEETFEAAIEKYIEKQNAPPEAGEVKPISDRDYVRGNPDAEITFIEYSDFECPFCKKSHPTVQEIVDHYDGKVNWVYRHFPLGFHDPHATKEAEAVECVGELGGNDKFWEMNDLIFETTRSNKGLEPADLPALASRIGIDQDEFKTCLDSGKYTGYIRQSIAEGSKAGVQGTPGNIILNNKTGKKKLVSGAQPFSSFQAAIDSLLE